MQKTVSRHYYRIRFKSLSRLLLIQCGVHYVPLFSVLRSFVFLALFQRHPAMAGWPAGHEWLIAKIKVEEAWTISYYGEATVLSAKDYYGVDSIVAGGNTAGSEL